MFPRNGIAIVKCIFAKNGMVGEFWIMKSWHYRIIQEMIFFAFKIESESENHWVVSNSLQPHGLYSPWDSPGQNTGVGSLSLLQGIFPTQGSNPGLPHCRRILYQLNHKDSPRILEWVAYPFSRRSSLPRNWTRVSCIAGRFFTSWSMNGEILKAFLLRLRMKNRLIIITDSIHHLRSPS